MTQRLNPTPRKGSDIVRSSAAEYLTFVAAAGDDPQAIEIRYEDEDVWLTQKMMAELYAVAVPTINYHLKRVLDDLEVDETSLREFLIDVGDGRQFKTKHYGLRVTLAVDFKIENERAVQFRKWAGQIVKDYTIQGWAMDAERIKQGHLFTDAYFDYAELQARRRIPMSMEDWSSRLDGFLEFNGTEVLIGPGRISHEEAKLHAESEFEKYRIVQDQLFVSDFDRFLEGVSEHDESGGDE